MLSCNSKKPQDLASKKKLNILTTTHDSDTSDNSSTKKVITEVNSDYFEIDLCLQNEQNGYIATKELEKPTSIAKFHSVNIVITNTNEEIIHFKGSTDFLNFMSSCGYEMVNQQIQEYCTDYTFKKK